MIEQAGGRAVAVRVDHTRDEEVAGLAARVRNETGRLDVLVNSIWGAIRCSIGRIASGNRLHQGARVSRPNTHQSHDDQPLPRTYHDRGPSRSHH